MLMSIIKKISYEIRSGEASIRRLRESYEDADFIVVREHLLNLIDIGNLASKKTQVDCLID